MKIYSFSTPSCTWCKVAEPKVEEYAKENNIEIIKVNAESEAEDVIDGELTEKELTLKYEVMSVPVVVFEDHGEEQQKLTGFEEIMQFINQ